MPLLIAADAGQEGKLPGLHKEQRGVVYYEKDFAS